MADSDPLMRMAILTALAECPGLPLEVDELERRVMALLELGERELRRRAAAVREQHRN